MSQSHFSPNQIQDFLLNFTTNPKLGDQQGDLFLQEIPPKTHKLTLDKNSKIFDSKSGLEPELISDEISLSKHQNIPCFEKEFWTSCQRQSSSLHEISYRACFKAELPNFFIDLLTKPKDVIYDPFSGRGTTAIEAGMMGRNIIANDINPLSKILSSPRLSVPSIESVKSRLDEIKLIDKFDCDLDLSMFFEQETLREILCLKNYLKKRREAGEEDEVDNWIRMVATNRLTGHSPGFFSVYTLPPNQAVSPKKQEELNRKSGKFPTYRDVKKIIFKKTLSLLRDVSDKDRKNLRNISKIFTTNSAANNFQIVDNSVNLIITSPPFLSVIDYAADNWLRCWFNDLNLEEIRASISCHSKITDWQKFITACFADFYRVIRPNGYVAFEVGEVNLGKIKLEDYVLPIGESCGLKPIAIIINSQKFTKTSNIWGVANNSKGTNSNRIILFQK